MKAKRERKTPLTTTKVEDLAERELARLGVTLSAEEQVAARFRAYNTLANQADPDLAWKLTSQEIRRRINCATESPKVWGTRHRLLTSVSTDSELSFLNRLYEMAKVEATHVCQWSGSNPALDEPVWAAGQLLNRAETRAYNALMQIGYDPDDRRNRVNLHTALVVQMVFHLIGLYKKG